MADVVRRASALATNVRRLRESHGLSLQQLADRAGLAKTTLFKIESGRSNPTLETMLALGEFFSVSIAELLGGDATPAIEVVRAGTEGVDISGTAVTGALVRSMMVGRRSSRSSTLRSTRASGRPRSRTAPAPASTCSCAAGGRSSVRSGRRWSSASATTPPTSAIVRTAGGIPDARTPCCG